MDNIEEFRRSFEKSATIVSCLLEFSSIEQALASTTESDKVKLEILNKDLSSASIPTIKTTKNAGHSGRTRNRSTFFPSNSTIDQLEGDRSNQVDSRDHSRQPSVGGRLARSPTN